MRCRIGNCERSILGGALGMCRTHYRRKTRGWTPDEMAEIPFKKRGKSPKVVWLLEMQEYVREWGKRYQLFEVQQLAKEIGDMANEHGGNHRSARDTIGVKGVDTKDTYQPYRGGSGIAIEPFRHLDARGPADFRNSRCVSDSSGEQCGPRGDEVGNRGKTDIVESVEHSQEGKEGAK